MVSLHQHGGNESLLKQIITKTAGLQELLETMTQDTAAGAMCREFIRGQIEALSWVERKLEHDN